MEEIIEMKHCKKCDNDYPKTEEYFYKQKSNKCKSGYYLQSQCKECTKKLYKNWRKKNPDKVKENCKRQASKEERKKYVRKYAKEQRESGYQKEYQQKYPDKMKIYSQNHQHKEHNITEEEWKMCKEYFNNNCAYCGLPIEEHFMKYNGSLRKSDLHKEHVDNNGSNDLSNCIPSCQSCNSQKWEFEFDKWYNENNPNFTQERYDKIIKWLNEDYIIYINYNNTNLINYKNIEEYKEMFEIINNN
jgi:hypothetical protein